MSPAQKAIRFMSAIKASCLATISCLRCYINSASHINNVITLQITNCTNTLLLTLIAGARTHCWVVNGFTSIRGVEIWGHTQCRLKNLRSCKLLCACVRAGVAPMEPAVLSVMTMARSSLGWRRSRRTADTIIFFLVLSEMSRALDV